MSMETGLPAETDTVGHLIARDVPLRGSKTNGRSVGRAFDKPSYILYKI